MKDMRAPAQALRELHNWLAVFEEEYELPDEVSRVLREKIQEVGKAMNEEIADRDELHEELQHLREKDDTWEEIVAY